MNTPRFEAPIWHGERLGDSAILLVATLDHPFFDFGRNTFGSLYDHFELPKPEWMWRTENVATRDLTVLVRIAPPGEQLTTLLFDYTLYDRYEVPSTADKGLPEEMLADLTVEKVERAIDNYQQVADLETRVERITPRFVKWEILRYLMAQHGVMVEYIEILPDQETLDDLRENLDDGYDEAKLEMLERAHEGGQDGCADRIEEFIGLTDGLLDDLSYGTYGDPIDDGSVRVVCEHADRQFETILETEDNRVNVDWVGEFLNRIVDETTADDRRFCWTGVSGDLIDVGHAARVGVWFLEGGLCETLDTYFSRARNSVRA